MRERRPRLDRRTFLSRAAGAAALGLGSPPVWAEAKAPSTRTSGLTRAQRFPHLRQHFARRGLAHQKKLPRQYWWDLEPNLRKGAPARPGVSRPIAPTTR